MTWRDRPALRAAAGLLRLVWNPRPARLEVPNPACAPPVPFDPDTPPAPLERIPGVEDGDRPADATI